MDDCTTLGSASTASISSYLYPPDTPPPEIDTEVLPANLQTKISECEGNDNCKLISYDFNTNTGTKASSSPYILQTQSLDPDKTDVAILAEIGTTEVTSLGIPTEDLDTQYNPSHLQVTPPIAVAPIGYTPLEDGVALFSSTGTSTPTATSVDACAVQCNNTSTCKGFNFNESNSTCKLFSLVDSPAFISTLAGGSSSTVTFLNLWLNSPGISSGRENGLYIEGLDDYINGTVIVSSWTNDTNLSISFTEQVVKQIPAGTKIRVKSRKTKSSTTRGYMSEKEQIDTIGVDGSETYGYNATFGIQGLSALPTTTTFTANSEASTAKLTAEQDLTLPFSGTLQESPVFSTAILPIVKGPGPSGCTSGLFVINDAQDTSTCTCSTESVADPACRVPMSVKSQTGSSVTVTRPIGSYFPYGVANGSRMILNAIQFTVTLNSGTPSPRIIGWTGTITHANGTIPVTVKSYTTGSPATITFTFPSTSYGTINTQNVTLSDSKGRTCKDIKACNASIQRLLDTSGISSFSTKDILACEGCNERAYKKPSSALTAAQLLKLREYLWFDNEGVFACPNTALPSGASTRDSQCTPVCDVPSNADSATYSAASGCRVTCRNGFYWNGYQCVSCPQITLPFNVTVQLQAACQATCMHASGATPAGMTITAQNTGNDTTPPNYTTACVVTCSTGAPNGDTTRCCPVSTVTPPTGTRIASYSDNCVTPVCETTDGTNDFIASASGSGTGTSSTCSVRCQTFTTQHGTSEQTLAVSASSIITFPVYYSGTGIENFSPINLPMYTSSDANSTKVMTNMGSYYFYPASSHAAMNTTIPSYSVSLSGSSTSILFPFKIKLKQIGFYYTGSITSIVIELFTVRDGTRVTNQTVSLTGSPTTVTSFTTTGSGYGAFLRFTYTGTGTVSYRMTAYIIDTPCLKYCSHSSYAASTYSRNPTGYPVLDSTICKTVCNSGYIPDNSGCVACTTVDLDPGTNYSLDSGVCSGTCTVFDPLTQQIAATLVNAYAYSGTTNTGATTFTAASGTARACHINTCPSGRTKYTDTINTTLNNSGCCPVPTIRITKGGTTTTITDGSTGITWSYPSGSVATTVSTGQCSLTCTLPATAYGMTITTTSATSGSPTATCTGTCPNLTAPSGYTVTQKNNCEPVCAFSTTDANAQSPSATYINGTVTCSAKTCINANYSKNSGTGHEFDVCCPTKTAGPNTSLDYGSTSCNANPCIVVNTSSGNTNGAALSGSTTCQVNCKTVSADPGTNSSYTNDGLCTLSCTTIVANATATAVNASGGNSPKCTFGCATGYYKPTSVALCCQDITLTNGATVTKNANDCGFTCVAPSGGLVTTSGRSCLGSCPAVTAPSNATVNRDSGSCAFTCVGPNRIETYTYGTNSCTFSGCNDSNYMSDGANPPQCRLKIDNTTPVTGYYDRAFSIVDALCPVLTGSVGNNAFTSIFRWNSTLYYAVQSYDGPNGGPQLCLNGSSPIGFGIYDSVYRYTAPAYYSWVVASGRPSGVTLYLNTYVSSLNKSFYTYGS